MYVYMYICIWQIFQSGTLFHQSFRPLSKWILAGEAASVQPMAGFPVDDLMIMMSIQPTWGGSNKVKRQLPNIQNLSF